MRGFADSSTDLRTRGGGGGFSGGENLGTPKFLMPCARLRDAQALGHAADTQQSCVGRAPGTPNHSSGYTRTIVRVSAPAEGRILTCNARAPAPPGGRKRSAADGTAQEMARMAQKLFWGEVRHERLAKRTPAEIFPYPPPPPCRGAPAGNWCSKSPPPHRNSVPPPVGSLG